MSFANLIGPCLIITLSRLQRTYLKDLIEQLKGENSRKWRLQERDDWKSLVDSVQADRVRLQEETIRLNMLLEQSAAEIQRQAEVIQRLSVSRSFSTSVDGDLIPREITSTESYHDEPSIEPTGGESVSSVVLDKASEQESFLDSCPARAPSSSKSSVLSPHASRPGSPSLRNSGAVIQKLRMELDQANGQV